MGLVSKAKNVQSEELTHEEIEFIVNKLRSANFRGDEFEKYFGILKKLTDALNLSKK